MRILLILLALSCSLENKKDQTKLSDVQLIGDPLIFKGFVQKAFEIKVNGKEYEDIEHFFSETVDDLPKQAEKAGYKDFTVKFDAEIGFKDLYNSMDVYMSAKDERGYLGNTQVDKKGKFKLEMPWDANEDIYKLRANKRIAVKLISSHKVIKSCYNFSAIDKSVKLSDTEKPIILDEFKTSLTRYDCSKDGDGKIEIEPAKDTLEWPDKISPGDTKAVVDYILGGENLTITGDGLWCYVLNEGWDIPKQCAEEGLYGPGCTCFIGFDDDGLVNDQLNIDPTYLNHLKW